MSNIGELFKYMGGNKTFETLCNDSNKSNDQVIESVYQDEELINKIRTFSQDDDVIKSKLVILIGQKRKPQKQIQKPQVQDKTEKQVVNEEQVVNKEQVVNEDEAVDEKPVFKYKPFDVSKVVYLNDYAYIEKVDHRMRLVTLEYEIYY
jgi:hypothetical protein